MSSPEHALSEGAPDLLRVLWETHHALMAMSRSMERELGLSGPKRLVLREVARTPGITLGRLAAVLGVHPSTITGLVDALVLSRALARARDPRDRRAVRLRPTPAGQALLEKDTLTIEAVVARMEAADPAAAAETARFLEALSASLRAASRRSGAADPTDTATGPVDATLGAASRPERTP